MSANSTSKTPKDNQADQMNKRYYDPESFGYQQVDESERQSRVNSVFSSVAENYDLMNDMMSGGMHRLWKTAFVDWMATSPQISANLLDVAGGTGDISLRYLEKAAAGSRATVCDINGEMMRMGKKRSPDLVESGALSFVQGNAECLPFPDNHFDYYTIAFGIRNVTNINKALEEALRVLRPGGRFMCLEFSKVDVPILDKVYDFFSFNAIPQMGQVIAGDKESYVYLVESIRQFPSQDQFGELITQAGFGQMKYRNLSGGIAAMHSGWKI